MALCNYRKVTAQFVPFNDLHADIRTLRISAVQVENLFNGSLYGENLNELLHILNAELENGITQ